MVYRYCSVFDSDSDDTGHGHTTSVTTHVYDVCICISNSLYIHQIYVYVYIYIYIYIYIYCIYTYNIQVLSTRYTVTCIIHITTYSANLPLLPCFSLHSAGARWGHTPAAVWPGTVLPQPPQTRPNPFWIRREEFPLTTPF